MCILETHIIPVLVHYTSMDVDENGSNTYMPERARLCRGRSIL